MHTSEVLNLAADLIEERGWPGLVGDVVDPWGGGAGSSAPLCLEGGILAAQGVALPVIGDGREAVLDELRYCPAYVAVGDHLGDALLTSSGSRKALYRWNDELGRTAAEVIEVLRATAVIEAARESKAVEVSA